MDNKARLLRDFKVYQLALKQVCSDDNREKIISDDSHEKIISDDSHEKIIFDDSHEKIIFDDSRMIRISSNLSIVGVRLKAPMLILNNYNMDDENEVVITVFDSDFIEKEVFEVLKEIIDKLG